VGGGAGLFDFVQAEKETAKKIKAKWVSCLTFIFFEMQGIKSSIEFITIACNKKTSSGANVAQTTSFYGLSYYHKNGTFLTDTNNGTEMWSFFMAVDNDLG
jgi:hypothetical protein